MNLLMSPLVCIAIFLLTSGVAEGDTDKIPSSRRKPLVILISSDGFRWGHQFKVPTPNIDFLRRNGVESYPGMIPVYPTLTFPNHYSIATGLHPAWHGIIANKFRVRDPLTNAISTFVKSNTDPKYWLGEPIWQTVNKAGLKAAVHFWPGSQVVKPGWPCDPEWCPQFDASATMDQAIDAVFRYVDRADRPEFIAAYLNKPDVEEHKYGPDGPLVDEDVAGVDAVLGRLLDGLHKRRILHQTDVIFVSDHGFTGICSNKLVFLGDLKLNITTEWFDWEWYRSPMVGITPPAGVDHRKLVDDMNSGLPAIENGKFLKMYLKEDLPKRLHYWQSERIPPIVGLIAEGYEAAIDRSNVTTQCQCAGDHGFDNKFMSMRSVFFARGPGFLRNVRVKSFQNVEIYNIITTLLGIRGASNNGTRGFANSMLSANSRLASE